MKRTIRYSQQEVEKIFLDNNCECLDLYVNNRTKIRYKCSCENISYTYLWCVVKGHKCKSCGNKKSSKSQNLSYDFVYNYFKEPGCELLETHYINNQTKMKYKCICGTIAEIHFNNFKNGRRCLECKRKKLSEIRIGEKNANWNPDRNKVRDNINLRSLSGCYIKRFKKKYNITDKSLVVDHIFHIKAFTDYNIYDLDTINSEDNLQVISRKDNSDKHDNYDKLLFENYLKNKNIPILQN